jgi:hypothetical protein
MVSIYQTPEEAGSKATLGSTDATGGYIIPNNLVESIMKPKTAENMYRSLLTVVPDVRGSGVDQPLRNAAPSRMVVAAWGALKENANLTYDSYTATLSPSPHRPGQPVPRQSERQPRPISFRAKGRRARQARISRQQFVGPSVCDRAARRHLRHLRRPDDNRWHIATVSPGIR